MFKYKNFWMSFFIIFLLGNFLIGLFETVSYDVIYPFIEKFKGTRDLSKRFFVLFPFLKYFIGLSYTIYSFYILFQYIDKVKHTNLLKLFLVFYYVSFVFVLSYLQYCSPISYLASYVYTDMKYKESGMDIKTYKRNYYKGDSV